MVWTITGTQIPGLPNVSTTDNVVAGNYIGTNVAGTSALPNGAIGAWGGTGVWFLAGARDNWLGVNPVYGPANSDEGNLIAGNSSTGVLIEDNGTTGNVVAGNLIGTDAGGSSAIAERRQRRLDRSRCEEQLDRS